MNLNVKTILGVLLTVPLAIVIIIILFLNYIYSVIELRDKKNQWFSELNYHVSQLNMVGYDVVMYSEEARPRQQWVIISKKVAVFLQTDMFDQGYESVFIESLRNRQRKMSKLFERMTLSSQQILHATQRQQQLARQILHQTQSIKNDIYKALKRNDLYYNEIRQQIILMIVGIAFFLVLVIFVSVYHMYFGVTRPLNILKKWSSEFVRGHLDKEIALDTSNEFKHLADSFFELGWQLKQNYIELEKNKEISQNLEARNQLLISHLNDNISDSGVGYLDWDIDRGVFYLTKAAINILGLKANKTQLKFNDLINLIALEERPGLIYQLERCRDTSKKIETHCHMAVESGTDKKLFFQGNTVSGLNRCYISIQLSLTLTETD